METLGIIADICEIFSCLFLAYMLIDTVCCEIRIRRTTKKHRPQDEYVIEGAADCFDLTDCQPENPSPLISKSSISELEIGDTKFNSMRRWQTTRRRRSREAIRAGFPFWKLPDGCTNTRMPNSS